MTSIDIDLFTYAYFMLSVMGISWLFICPLTRSVFPWEHATQKSSSVYLVTDVWVSLLLLNSLFLFGNYSQTFTWITLVSSVVGHFGFGALGELKFAKHSLVTFRSWPVQLWILTLAGIAVIIALTAYHVYLSVRYQIALEYLLALVGAIAGTLGSTLCLMYWHNNRISQTCVRLISSGSRRLCLPASSSNGIIDREQQSTDIIITTEDQPQVRATLHPHHWQIFLLLAYFTRFPEVVSQICAGLCIGIFMHGSCAYGYGEVYEFH